MKDLFDSDFDDDFLFGDFSKLFSKVWNNFKRPVADQFPYMVTEKENGYLIVCNTLGLDKKDVKVNLEKRKGLPFPTLRIEGETNLENIKFQNKISLGISLRIEEENIESMKYSVNNGLTTIFIKVKKDEPKKALEAEYTDDSLDF